MTSLKLLRQDFQSNFVSGEKDMKKFSAILVAVILAFSLVLLVSCGNKDKDKNPNSDGSIDFPIVDYTPNE